MKNATCLLLLLVCQLLGLNAQSSGPERRPGEILIHLASNARIERVLEDLNRTSPTPFALKQTLSAEWNMHLLDFEEIQDDPSPLLSAVRRHGSVHSAQWNHRVEERSLEPNDTEWWRQGDMVLINAPTVWETTTGGLTPNGDTIVVAVLEKGALMTHPDLAPNRYFNRLEIPNNGIDDDGNGYIDDFGGWNPKTQADDMGNLGFHGTAVNGIIGARGNNEQGIAGVNWRVKLMPISGLDFEHEIIQGYYYVGKMRALYNQTNGAKGAFVVVTNASFGFDKARAEDHPVWCAVYDSLGKVGVLGVGATTNADANVDVVGDMPTSCPSEYLISVTNIFKSGNRVPAGYGSVSIDLGAPGTDTYSTYSSSSGTPTYGTIGGCSAAAPHVAGGVGLFYSLGCEQFTIDAIYDPANCARRVRDAILQNTAPNPTLSGLTVTGGHLDLARALQGVRDFCDGATVGPLDFLQIRTLQEGNRLRIYYQTPNFQPYNFRVFNMLGQQLYESKLVPQQFAENYVDFDMTHLPRGVYVFSIGRGDIVKSRKFPKI